MQDWQLAILVVGALFLEAMLIPCLRAKTAALLLGPLLELVAQDLE